MGLDYAALGKRIRKLRKEKGMTQSELAEQVKIETSNISHIERGVSKAGTNTLYEIAVALGVTLNDLFCDSFPRDRSAYENELLRIAEDCSPQELRILADAMQGLKQILREEFSNDDKR